MKLKSKLSLILIFALVLVVIAPTFAWYEINGYLYADINNRIAKKENSEFKITYALRDMQTVSQTLNGIAPDVNFGESAIGTAEGFASETEWAKNNDGANDAVKSVILSEGAVVLSGQLGDKVSVGDGGAGDQVENADPEDEEDNRIPFDSAQSSAVTSVESLSEVKALADDDSSLSESDNRFNITGNFSAEKNKLVGVTVNIAPKDSENESDIISASSVNYAIYYQKTHDSGVAVTGGEKIVFANNAFNYIAGSTYKKAVSQNGYFLAEENCTYSVVAVVWLDGFADARAETGAFTFSAYFNDLANITSNVTSDNGVLTAEILNSVETENLNIPSAYYSGTDLVEITSVAEQAFKDKTYLKSVVLPDTVETIGERAFIGCSALESIHFGNGLTSIGANAFLNCSALSSATFANPYGWTTDISNKTPQEIAGLLKTNTESLTKNS